MKLNEAHACMGPFQIPKLLLICKVVLLTYSRCTLNYTYLKWTV